MRKTNEIDGYLRDNNIEDVLTDLGQSAYEHAHEVVRILEEVGCKDENMITAGMMCVFHRAGRVSYNEISNVFGREVLDLIQLMEPSNEGDWLENREIIIERTKNLPLEQKRFVLAEILSDQRYLVKRHSTEGEMVWETLDTPKELYQVYYAEMQESLEDMQADEAASDKYWDLVATFKDLFVTYYIDRQEEVIYQMHGMDGFRFQKNYPTWEDEFIGPPENAERISRVEAESIEEGWREPLFTSCHIDAAVTDVEIGKDQTGSIRIKIINYNMKIIGLDIKAKDPKGNVIKDPVFILDEDNTFRFLCRLRLRYGIYEDITSLLRKTFGMSSRNQTTGKILQFLKEEHLRYKIEENGSV